ncbi:MAG: chitobiase/beta-hexosaminidase C-terminal domain-containing protein, partial [Bacteroidales bacterium]|nr:chitobiase/beta-hexosaminidase C-terminal domain-containing protein [Bacteroidales bacterium]
TMGNANSDVITAFGTGYKAPEDFVQILSGENYQVFVEKKLETPWISVPSKEITEATEITLSAISEDSAAKLVYTLDGTTPTTSSKAIENSEKITITGACTLKVGLLSNGEVKNIQTRTYTEPEPFEPYDIDVYVNVENVSWSKVNFWTWGGDESHAPKSGKWPGDEVKQTKVVDGKTYYYQTYRINSAKDLVNFVWSTGSGSPQTEDVTNVVETSYYEILNEKSGDKYKVKLVSTIPSGIDSVSPEPEILNSRMYNISGQEVDENFKGVIIQNRKKYLKR